MPKHSPVIVPVHTYQAVNASDLFKGLKKLWNEFVESNPPFTWGDVSHSFITGDDIVFYLESVPGSERQYAVLRDRVGNLSNDVFIDLAK